MNDDRVVCTSCADLAPDNRCRAAMRRERVDVPRSYGPPHPTDVLRRCEWFKPKRGEEDQRLGRERWPSLYADYVKRFPEAA